MRWQLCLVCVQTLDAVTNAMLLVIQSSIELSFPMKILNEAVQHLPDLFSPPDLLDDKLFIYLASPMQRGMVEKGVRPALCK